MAKPVAMDPVARRRAHAAGPLAIGDPHSGKPLKGDIGGLRIYDRAAHAGEVETLAVHEPVRAILPPKRASARRTRSSACSITS